MRVRVTDVQAILPVAELLPRPKHLGSCIERPRGGCGRRRAGCLDADSRSVFRRYAFASPIGNPRALRFQSRSRPIAAAVLVRIRSSCSPVSRAAAASIRWRVSSGMRGLRRRASETVLTENPVASAMSFSRAPLFAMPCSATLRVPGTLIRIAPLHDKSSHRSMIL